MPEPLNGMSQAAAVSNGPLQDTIRKACFRKKGWKADMTFGSKDRFWFFLFLAAGAIIGGLLGNFLEASQFFGLVRPF